MFGLKDSCSDAVVQQLCSTPTLQHRSALIPHLKTVVLHLVSTVRCDFPEAADFRIGSKFRCIRSTPTEMQSMSENDFECFASTGVNTPGTMSPNPGYPSGNFPEADQGGRS